MSLPYHYLQDQNGLYLSVDDKCNTYFSPSAIKAVRIYKDPKELTPVYSESGFMEWAVLGKVPGIYKLEQGPNTLGQETYELSFNYDKPEVKILDTVGFLTFWKDTR